MTVALESGNGLALFQHVKRLDWGLAILAWEGPDKRRYQFQDGQLRTFKQGYYQLLQEVDRPLSEAQAVHQELGAKLDLSIARNEVIAETAEKGRPSVMTIADQVLIFESLYPEGFNGERWTTGVRGEGAPRALKKHRAPALAMAAEKLSAEALQSKIDAGDFESILADAILVARKTSLVPSTKELAVFEELKGDGAEAFARTLMDLLYGDDTYGKRFGRFVSLLGEGGSWVTNTLFPGLVFPNDHVIIRPSSFRQQAQWMAPRLRNATDVTPGNYKRFLNMAKRVRGELEKAGAVPRDYVDVHDFIWATMRPSARQSLESLKA